MRISHIKREWEPVLTLSRVVMASVAMLRLVSEIRFSKSTLQLVTTSGCNIAIWRKQTRYLTIFPKNTYSIESFNSRKTSCSFWRTQKYL